MKKSVNKKEKISIASDHKGYELKEKIVNYLKSAGYTVADYGASDKDISVDYPDYSKLVCDSVSSNQTDIGILLCRTGVGMSISANRNSEIRAALCFNIKMAELSRSHNNANILVLGAEIIDKDSVFPIVDKFLATKFEGGRHSIRLGKIG